MKLFPYFFRVLYRQKGFIKSPAFSSNKIKLICLRYLSYYSADRNQLVRIPEYQSIKPDEISTVEIKPQPICTTLTGLADKYEILQKFVDLGVDIKCFEKDLQLCGTILKLDYETHIVPFLKFLLKHGVTEEELGKFITANPRIFLSDIDNLQVRVNYLCSKKFSRAMIAKIITKNPKWLSHEIKFVDAHLGDLQQTFHLSGDEVRKIVVTFPALLKVKSHELHFCFNVLKNTLCLNRSTIKSIIVAVPRLLRTDCNVIIATYNYLTENMSVSRDLVLAQPKVLLYRLHFIKPKHLFLKKLGIDQYNPKLPGYISLMDLVTANEEEFAKRIAKSTIELYNEFQKTL